MVSFKKGSIGSYKEIRVLVIARETRHTSYLKLSLLARLSRISGIRMPPL
jgi:hypothetical protein